MNKLPAILAAAVLCFAQAKPQAAEGPAFPGNEALRFVNGKRVVELPPLHENQQKVLASGRSVALKPTDRTLQVYMIEGERGPVECTSSYFREGNCRDSSIGNAKLGRLWVVKRNNSWWTCVSRKPNAQCDQLHGALEGIGERE